MKTTTTFDLQQSADLLRWENEGGGLGYRNAGASTEALLPVDAVALEAIVRTHSQRLFRIVRSIVVSDDEAETVLADTYTNGLKDGNYAADPAELSLRLMRLAIEEARAPRRNLSAPASKHV